MIYLAITGFLFLVLSSLSEEGKLPSGWNKKDTWERKYNWTEDGTRSGLKYGLFTNFVLWVVDWFHFFQFVYLTCFQAIVSVQYFDGWYILLGIAGLKVIQGLIQEGLRLIFKR